MKPSLDALVQSGRLRRADAALGAWIMRAFPEVAPDITLAAALAARAVGDGHSVLELARAQDWFAQLEGTGKPPALPDPETWQARLRAAATVCRSDALDVPAPLTLDAQGRVYLSRYFEAERRVAAGLAAHATRDSQTPAREHVDDTAALDPEQRRAVHAALAHNLVLVTGGPGSGKTFSVAHMLVALLRAGNPRIALAAPTGKAAARLDESLHLQVVRMALPETLLDNFPREASTLHRLLGISPWRVQPRHHHHAPLPFDVVVVDEASMVDLTVMARLTDALAPDTRLILLGDPNQLSAVEAGNVLPALVEAAATPPFDACHVALRSSHRFGADSTLGALAQAIVGDDAETVLVILDTGSEDVRLLDGADRTALVKQACDDYAPMFRAGDAGAALTAARTFRVLTALRHGPHGSLALNHAIEARLKRTRGLRPDAQWWPGRLVIVTSNRDELHLYNGDTGVVWPDADGALKVWFEGSGGSPRAFVPSTLPPHEGAFALTVHKAQGSEFDNVAMVTGPESPVLTRELLYTGVTRAREGVTVYSTAETLATGIKRRTLRMTGLADRLREAVQAAGT